MHRRPYVILTVELLAQRSVLTEKCPTEQPHLHTLPCNEFPLKSAQLNSHHYAYTCTHLYVHTYTTSCTHLDAYTPMQQEARSAERTKARSDQTVLAREIKRLRDELASQQVGTSAIEVR